MSNGVFNGIKLFVIHQGFTLPEVEAVVDWDKVVADSEVLVCLEALVSLANHIEHQSHSAPSPFKFTREILFMFCGCIYDMWMHE